MATVIFMRGVNVGGHKAFRPAALAKELSDHDVVNIGAAGTFVVRTNASQATLRTEILRRLPFEPELMICRGRDILDLVAADPFPRQGTTKDLKRFVTFLAKAPRTKPRLPLDRPEGRDWQVRLVELRGKLALSLWRRAGKKLLYPNEVVEKELGVPATTRTWDTIVKIHDVLTSD